MLKNSIIATLLMTSLAVPALAKHQAQPQTKLLSFLLQKNQLIIRGFEAVDKVTGNLNGTTTINVIKAQNESNGKTAKGVSFRLKPNTGVSTIYIDHDELSDLIKAFESIIKMNSNSPTSLKRWRTEYVTKGGLSVIAFTRENGAISMALSSNDVNVFYNLDRFKGIKDAVVKAKKRLGELK